MSSEASQKRKVLVAREDLVNSLSLVAKKRGSTLYSLTNEIIEQALRAESMGVTLRDVLDTYEVLKANRSAGQMLVPIDVLIAIVSKLTPRDLEEIEKLWKEAGRWYGEYVTIRFREDFRDAQSLEKILKEIRWEFVDLVIQNEGNGMRVRCVSPQIPVELMKLISMFIEGFLEALAYKVERRNIFKGILDIYATKTQQKQ
ncbi:hypothetical protein QPL79_00395 [Ignisphaera sp. 4213-co]|uniref:CopG family transcriptional regulator n=1 Tax=Ignisphaera cupida TaxID=3050454 RepID=A0ABD4Z5C2_9CREN|nr:hypothetical protein [Ignisphaera sp. 4213-co]MDK6027828.1 hypothetical protein [Ignisphaera sp. 4213-co]